MAERTTPMRYETRTLYLVATRPERHNTWLGDVVLSEMRSTRCHCGLTDVRDDSPQNPVCNENLSARRAEMLRARGLEVVSAYKSRRASAHMSLRQLQRESRQSFRPYPEVGDAELDDGAQLAYTTRERRRL